MEQEVGGPRGLGQIFSTGRGAPGKEVPEVAQAPRPAQWDPGAVAAWGVSGEPAPRVRLGTEKARAHW